MTLSGGQPSRVIDINADVVEQKLELSFPEGGGQADKVPFGTVYYGVKRQVKAMLTNNGPHTCQFNIQLEENSNDEEVAVLLYECITRIDCSSLKGRRSYHCVWCIGIGVRARVSYACACAPSERC